MLIGIFPSGTRPHTFVSTWFFIQGDLAIIIWRNWDNLKRVKEVRCIYTDTWISFSNNRI